MTYQIVDEALKKKGLALDNNVRVVEAAIAALQRGLIAFGATSEGEAFFRKIRQIDFRPIDEATLRRIDPFTTVLMEQR
jgi:hypothetical protein